MHYNNRRPVIISTYVERTRFALSTRLADSFLFADPNLPLMFGTRTLAEGPLFLIGDFQKLHPRDPFSLRGVSNCTVTTC